MIECQKETECIECGLKQVVKDKCVRCNYQISKNKPNLDIIRAFSLTGCVCMLILISTPMFSMVFFDSKKFYLYDTYNILESLNFHFVALSVVFTSMIAPTLFFLFSFYLSIANRYKHPKIFASTLTILAKLKYWCLLEVYLVGLYIALHELVVFSVIIPEISLYVLIITIISHFMIVNNLDFKFFWSEHQCR